MNISRTAGIFLFASFLAMAVSVLCLASVQTNAMTDCSGSHGSPALCPFMSASVPAVFNAPVSAERMTIVLAFISALFAITLRFNKENIRLDKLLVRMRQSKTDDFQNYSGDSVIALISSGILHSRVFAF